MPKERRAEANQYPMPEALQHIPEWATTARVEYPDGNQYLVSLERLPACWKTAVRTQNGLLKKGAAEEIASLALFRIVEFLA